MYAPFFPEMSQSLTLTTQVFINIHEYTNEKVCIPDSPEKNL